jgi:hypothetical protein
MPVANILEKITLLLQGVSGIGEVHDYERWSNDWSQFLSLFKDAEGKINGWMISRKSTEAEFDTTTLTVMRRHLFLIRGVYGLRDSDASETTFQALVEGIQNALDGASVTLTGVALNHGAANVRTIEARVFGTVLCHYTEIAYEVEEQVQV